MKICLLAMIVFLAATSLPAFAQDFSDLFSIESVSKKLASRGKCRSFVVVARNVTVFVLIDDGLPQESGFLWETDERTEFAEQIADLDLNVRKVEQNLPEPNLFANGPGAVPPTELMQKLNELLQDAARDGLFLCKTI